MALQDELRQARRRPRRRKGIIDLAIPFEEDRAARWFVHEYRPHGATLEEIAEVVGLTRERIRQIEERAIRKLRSVCATRGILLRAVLGRDVD